MHEARQCQGTSRSERRRCESRTKSTARHLPAAAWRHFHWVGLCLLLAACSNTSAPPSVTPAATRSVQPATITAYHGQTSTIFTVAWSPDGTRLASGGNDSTVQVWEARTGW